MAQSAIEVAKINGGDYVLMLQPTSAGTFKPVLCGLNLSIQRQTPTIDASDKCGVDVRPDNTKKTASAQMTGHILKSSITDVYGLSDLHTLIDNSTVASWKIVPKDGVVTTDMPGYDFDGFISQIEDTFNNGDMAQTSFTITVNEDVTFIDDVTPTT